MSGVFVSKLSCQIQSIKLVVPPHPVIPVDIFKVLGGTHGFKQLHVSCLTLFPSPQTRINTASLIDMVDLFWRFLGTLYSLDSIGGGFKSLLFSPLYTWGRFPICLIYFKWVETTNKDCFDLILLKFHIRCYTSEVSTWNSENQPLGTGDVFFGKPIKFPGDSFSVTQLDPQNLEVN